MLAEVASSCMLRRPFLHFSICFVVIIVKFSALYRRIGSTYVWKSFRALRNGRLNCMMVVYYKGIIAFLALLFIFAIPGVKEPFVGMSIPKYVYDGTNSICVPPMVRCSLISLPPLLKIMILLFLALTVRSLSCANWARLSSFS